MAQLEVRLPRRRGRGFEPDLMRYIFSGIPVQYPGAYRASCSELVFSHDTNATKTVDMVVASS